MGTEALSRKERLAERGALARGREGSRNREDRLHVSEGRLHEDGWGLCQRVQCQPSQSSGAHWVTSARTPSLCRAPMGSVRDAASETHRELPLSGRQTRTPMMMVKNERCWGSSESGTLTP